jgi:hypothetical protein
MITKLHIVRICICAVLTVLLIRAGTILSMIENMEFATAISYANDLGVDTSSIPSWTIILNTGWVYLTVLLAACLLWKWFGLPRKVYKQQFLGLAQMIFPGLQNEMD